MADFDWVTSRLAVGGAVDSLYDARKVASAGVTHVLCLRSNTEDEAPLWAKLKIDYGANPAKDDGEKKPVEWFEESLEFIFGALMSDSIHKVLVHCKSGINRAPSTVYAALLAFGLEPDEAMEMVKRARPEAELAYARDAERAVDELGY